jgi:hypothetical protein
MRRRAGEVAAPVLVVVAQRLLGAREQLVPSRVFYHMRPSLPPPLPLPPH